MHSTRNFALLVVVAVAATVILSSTAVVRAQSHPATCGGFVRADRVAAGASQHPDLTAVVVTLSPASGGAPQTVECTPFGYYVLPIDENVRGVYSISINEPTGWSFAPSSVSVDFSNPHACENDIDFSIMGFAVTGSVAVTNSDRCPASVSPSGVAVQLLTEHGSIISQTKTTNGNFVFTEVPPGVYTLQVSLPGTKFLQVSLLIPEECKPSFDLQDTMQVEVVWGNVALEKPFEIVGFDIKGTVASTDKEYIGGVELTLYDSTKTPVAQTFSKQTTGEFIFESVSCGQYTIIPQYKSGATVYNLNPSELPISVTFGRVVLDKPFIVVGFSISGRVLNSEQSHVGIEGVSVSFDGTPAATTDSDGSYTLEQVTSGKHDITASLPHHGFSSIKGLHLTPNSGSLPDIIVSSYDVCGIVTLHKTPASFSVTSIGVQLFSSSSKAKPKTIYVKSTGEFCFESVPKGEYRIAPVQTSSSPVQLLPSSLTVNVDKPVLNLKFTQSLWAISGHIVVLEPESAHPADLKITMEGPASATATITPDFKFSFTGLLSGTYKLQVAQVKGCYCWSENEINVKVSNGNVEGITFIQHGFSANVDISHPSSVVASNSLNTITKNLTRGLNRLCLPSTGDWSMTLSSCALFGSAPSLGISHLSCPSLSLKASMILVQGSVHFAGIPGGPQDHPVNVRMESILSDGTPEKMSETSVSQSTATYSTSGKIGETIRFTPQSSKLLFTPPSRTITVTSNECPVTVLPFEASLGVFLQGHVVPAMEGVEMTVSTQGTESTFTVLTDKLGSYSAGPLPSGISYSVSCNMAGFNCVPSGDGNFQITQLINLRVRVMEPGEPAQPLAGVLVSVSGMQFRSNNFTLSNGAVFLTGLTPGQYFIRPAMKEYTFTPSTMQVVLEEGKEDTDVLFDAKRVAFSVFGSVHFLNGEPFSNTAVLATAPGHTEEAHTDSTGQYRIRGLVPNTPYTITLKSTEDKGISHLMPSKHTLTVGLLDSHGADFIVVTAPNDCVISGTVDALPEVLQYLTVTASPTTGAGASVSASLGPSDHFELHKLKPFQKYDISVSGSVPMGMQCECSPMPATTVLAGADGAVHKTLELSYPCVSHLEKAMQEEPSSPILPLLFSIIVVIAAYNWTAVKQKASQTLHRFGVSLPKSINEAKAYADSFGKRAPRREKKLRS